MAPHIYVLHNKKQTPFNLIGSMMIIRVLPIHLPPCYEGGYLKPLHWDHIWLMMIIWSDPSMFHDAVSPWSLHIYHYEAMQGQGPHFPPTRKATIHIHRGEGGKGVKMGTLHWGGWGGGLPNLDHIWIGFVELMKSYIMLLFNTIIFNVGKGLVNPPPQQLRGRK